MNAEIRFLGCAEKITARLYAVSYKLPFRSILMILRSDEGDKLLTEKMYCLKLPEGEIMGTFRYEYEGRYFVKIEMHLYI